MIRLRKILLCDFVYYFAFLITIFYLLFYFSYNKLENKYNILETIFKLNIKKYKIDGNKLSIEFDGLIGNYYFNSIEEKNSFIHNYSINDTLFIKGSLIEPSNNTIPNIFNYKKYLYHKKIKYILNIESFSLIKKNNNFFYKIKDKVYKKIYKIDNNSYIFAFILGDSSYIEKSTYNNYKINGITHLFALSGLHISIFSKIILFFLKKLRCNELISLIITSIFLLFFSFVASFTPSILRASIFFILNSINKKYYFYIKPINILFLTFIILALINPHYIFYTSFILSFTITFFILFYNANRNKTSILKISIISFLSSLPIIVNMSYEINIIGFINNLFFIPYVSNIVFPISLLTVFNNKLIYLLNVCLKVMEMVSNFSSKIFNITFYISKLNTFEIIMYYFLLILIIRNKKIFQKIFIILIIAILFKPYFNTSDNIYYLDVNQGDSTLIVTKNNKSILIDTGGIINYEKKDWKKKNNDFNLMESNLIPFFKSIGLNKIDYLIISHGGMLLVSRIT